MERERERESRQFPFHDISGRERIAEDDDGDNPIERDKIQPGGSSGKTLQNSSSAERALSRARSARKQRDESKKTDDASRVTHSRRHVYARACACVRGKK